MDNSFTIKRRKPWLAAILSFVTTGLGQFYNGQWKKGLVLFVVETALGLGVVIGLASFPAMAVGVAVLLGFNVFVAVEAYLCAKRTDEYVLRPSNRWWVYALLITANFIAGGALDYTAKGYFYQSFKVPSKSMLQTLQVGDHFMAEILSKTSVIQRGDIVVFLEPEKGRHYVKRVIGLPEDVFEIRAQHVHIDGRQLSEPYVQHTKSNDFPERDELAPIRLNQDEYFLMGDNREESYDSRWFGPIARDAIKARVKYIYFPGHVGSDGWFDRLGMEVR